MRRGLAGVRPSMSTMTSPSSSLSRLSVWRTHHQQSLLGAEVLAELRRQRHQLSRTEHAIGAHECEARSGESECTRPVRAAIGGSALVNKLISGRPRRHT